MKDKQSLKAARRAARADRRDARNDARITRHMAALLKAQAKEDGTYQGRRGRQ